MKSMTGYGNSNFRDEFYEVDIEIKSLNHRFLDLSISINSEINHLEYDMRKKLSGVIKRGKVYANIYASNKKTPKIELDEVLLKQFADIYEKAYSIISPGSVSKPDPIGIISNEGVITRGRGKEEDLEFEEVIDQAFQTCLKRYEEMRVEEGNKIRNWLSDSKVRMEENLSLIESHLPHYREELKIRLHKVVEEILASPIDKEIEKRLMVEVAFYVDRYDINEELVRLHDHIDKFSNILKMDENETGKKMNFIVQEMHREIQTLSSKFNNVHVFPSILQIKEEIEKCRELIQNVE